MPYKGYSTAAGINGLSSGIESGMRMAGMVQDRKRQARADALMEEEISNRREDRSYEKQRRSLLERREQEEYDIRSKMNKLALKDAEVASALKMRQAQWMNSYDVSNRMKQIMEDPSNASQMLQDDKIKYMLANTFKVQQGDIAGARETEDGGLQFIDKNGSPLGKPISAGMREMSLLAFTSSANNLYSEGQAWGYVKDSRDEAAKTPYQFVAPDASDPEDVRGYSFDRSTSEMKPIKGAKRRYGEEQSTDNWQDYAAGKIIRVENRPGVLAMRNNYEAESPIDSIESKLPKGALKVGSSPHWIFFNEEGSDSVDGNPESGSGSPRSTDNWQDYASGEIIRVQGRPGVMAMRTNDDAETPVKNLESKMPQGAVKIGSSPHWTYFKVQGDGQVDGGGEEAPSNGPSLAAGMKKPSSSDLETQIKAQYPQARKARDGKWYIQKNGKFVEITM